MTDQLCILKPGSDPVRYSWCGMPIGQRAHAADIEEAERLTAQQGAVCSICLAVARREREALSRGWC